MPRSEFQNTKICFFFIPKTFTILIHVPKSNSVCTCTSLKSRISRQLNFVWIEVNPNCLLPENRQFHLNSEVTNVYSFFEELSDIDLDYGVVCAIPLVDKTLINNI